MTQALWFCVQCRVNPSSICFPCARTWKLCASVLVFISTDDFYSFLDISMERLCITFEVLFQHVFNYSIQLVPLSQSLFEPKLI